MSQCTRNAARIPAMLVPPAANQMSDVDLHMLGLHPLAVRVFVGLVVRHCKSRRLNANPPTTILIAVTATNTAACQGVSPSTKGIPPM